MGQNRTSLTREEVGGGFASPRGTISKVAGTSSLANRAALWIVSVLIVGMGVNWMSSATQAKWWIALLAATLTVIIVLTLPGGFFSRSTGGYGPTPLGRGVAIVLLGAYVGSAPFLSDLNNIALGLGSIALLWCAAFLMTWRSLRIQADIGDVAMAMANLLAGVAGLRLGVAGLIHGDTLLGFAGLLLGFAGLLLGVALLIDDETVFGVALLLFGVGFLLLGVAGLIDGDTVFGFAFLLFGVAGLLLGVALRLFDVAGLLLGVALRLFDVAGLLLGVGFLLFGVALLIDGDTVFGVALLLVVVALLLFRVALRSDGAALVGVGFLLLGVAALLLGVAFLIDGPALFGVGGLLLGVAALLGGATILVVDYSPACFARIGRRLLQRDPPRQRSRPDASETPQDL